ncbi:beta-lactamase family protein [Zopfia rhizophila CBS 207.26]|uniref:Beta-lactamase family protein n=1 Tax=Zopfia rhizophila CBS 207.26 TaxID=1314779 RepID=A0A6A6DQ80_9PEZI|nr:beta-lactamase family protein [Zopfia rhizophila CBS 207.26]
MANLEQIIEKACTDEEIPGCVLHANNRDGSITYAKAFGKRSVRPGGDQSPLQLNTTMWIASCTKLMTCISAMQCVERSLLSLDAPVYSILPELKNHPVIKGFKEDGTPIEEPHKTPITLRLLLTHSSGFSYDAGHSKSQAWLKYHGKEPSGAGKLIERFSNPLVFEPGTSWVYGPSIDWAGLMVERVSKLSLEEYMRKNLWEPLGIKDMTFYLSQHPELKKRMAEMSESDPKSGKVVKMDGRMPYLTTEGQEPEDCMGGQRVFASAEEYIKVVHALLTADENERILKKESMEEFFKPQLGEESAATLATVLKHIDANNAMGGTQQEIRKDWGLGGLLLCDDSPDGKRAGTMVWGGYPNLIWFCDRKAGLCGLYAGQVVPPGDSKCAALHRRFVATMYERAESASASASLSL